MKRYFIIETLEQMRTMSDPLRFQILTTLIKEELTGKQLATLLSISASKIHYHLKELESSGFIEVVRTEEKNGIMQKFYRAVAFDFKINEELLPSISENSLLMQETILNQFRMGINRVYQAPDESFMIFADPEKKPPFIVGNSEIKAPRDEIHAWLAKYKDLLNELSQLEARHLERIRAGEAEDNGELFFFLSAGFMTHEQVYNAEDETLPPGYELTSDIIVRKKKGEERHGEHGE